MKTYLLALAAITLIVASCKKESEGSTPTVQSIAGTYSFTKQTVSSGNSTETDVTNTYYRPCEKDNLFNSTLPN